MTVHPADDVAPDYYVKVAIEMGFGALIDALAWQVTMGDTTVTPPISVQQTLNLVRVHVSKKPWPLRNEDGTLIDGRVTAADGSKEQA